MVHTMALYAYSDYIVRTSLYMNTAVFTHASTFSPILFSIRETGHLVPIRQIKIKTMFGCYGNIQKRYGKSFWFVSLLD